MEGCVAALEFFSYCLIECLVMLGWWCILWMFGIASNLVWWCLIASLIVWQSVWGCLEGWSVVLDSFSYCSVGGLGMLGRLVGGV